MSLAGTIRASGRLGDRRSSTLLVHDPCSNCFSGRGSNRQAPHGAGALAMPAHAISLCHALLSGARRGLWSASGDGSVDGVPVARRLREGSLLRSSRRRVLPRSLHESTARSAPTQRIRHRRISFSCSGTSNPLAQELFRRFNMAPGATAVLVTMREQLLGRSRVRPERAAWTPTSNISSDPGSIADSWSSSGSTGAPRQWCSNA